MGVVADILWHCIPDHSPHVELGDFVVMPNHVHGILILNKPDDFGNEEPGHALALQDACIHPNRFQNIGKNTVSSIVGSYKSAVTKHGNRLGLDNGWQTLFYDSIIRDDAGYQRVSEYIINNPKNWKADKFYTK